jgi:hypothetical protein
MSRAIVLADGMRGERLSITFEVPIDIPAEDQVSRALLARGFLCSSAGKSRMRAAP